MNNINLYVIIGMIIFGLILIFILYRRWKKALM
jgi:LPXTG-motif cell wall-anchored protein